MHLNSLITSKRNSLPRCFSFKWLSLLSELSCFWHTSHLTLWGNGRFLDPGLVMVIITNSLSQIWKETMNVINISVIDIYMYVSDCYFSRSLHRFLRINWKHHHWQTKKFWLTSEQIQIVRMGPETSAKSVLSCFACWLFGQRIGNL